jgi:hypothetical protein
MTEDEAVVDATSTSSEVPTDVVVADVDGDGFVDVSFAKDGGVMKKILQEAPADAKGPPPNGNEVEAHYTGKL